MSKAKSKAKQLKGKMKETVGKTSGDQGMEAEGRADQLRGKARETAERAGDRVRKSTHE